MTEFDLIRDLLTKVNQPGRANAATDVSGGGAVWLGPGDDAAVIVGTRLVMSTDLTVEDIHFRRSWVTFTEAGTRAVTAAASDLAAMAATPVAVLISLAVAPEEAKAVLSELGDGIKIALDEIGAPLVGGDLSASPGPVFMDVTSQSRGLARMLETSSGSPEFLAEAPARCAAGRRGSSRARIFERPSCGLRPGSKKHVGLPSGHR